MNIKIALAFVMASAVFSGCASVDEDETVAVASSALFYSSVYDMSTMSNGVWTQPTNDPAALNQVASYCMPFEIEDYCADHQSDSRCTPVNINGKMVYPALIKIFAKTTRTGYNTWSPNYIYIPNRDKSTNIGSTCGLTKFCMRADTLATNKNNNWYCQTGSGGPGGSWGFSAFYGQ